MLWREHIPLYEKAGKNQQSTNGDSSLAYKIYLDSFNFTFFLLNRKGRNITFLARFVCQANCSRKHCHSRDLNQSWCQRCSITCPMVTVGQVGTGAAVEQLTAASGESLDFRLVLLRFLLLFLSWRIFSEYSWQSWTTDLMSWACDSMSWCAAWKNKVKYV